MHLPSNLLILLAIPLLSTFIAASPHRTKSYHHFPIPTLPAAPTAAPSLHKDCKEGVALFMCCKNWGGREERIAPTGLPRAEYARVSEHVLRSDEFVEYDCSFTGSKSVWDTLQNAQWMVFCPKPAEMVCCRGVETQGGKQKSACQVILDYNANKIGYGGLSGRHIVTPADIAAGEVKWKKPTHPLDVALMGETSKTLDG